MSARKRTTQARDQEGSIHKRLKSSVPTAFQTGPTRFTGKCIDADQRCVTPAAVLEVSTGQASKTKQVLTIVLRDDLTGLG